MSASPSNAINATKKLHHGGSLEREMQLMDVDNQQCDGDGDGVTPIRNMLNLNTNVSSRDEALPSPSATGKKKKPLLVQVIGGEDTETAEDTDVCSEDGDDEDEGGPPAISLWQATREATSTPTTTSSTTTTPQATTTQQKQAGPTLMETMLEEATKAHAKESQEKVKRERKEAMSSKNTSLGNGGFKKGFLNNAAKKKKKAAIPNTSASTSANAQRQSKVQAKSKPKASDNNDDTAVYELDGNGNLVKASDPNDSSQPPIITVTPNNNGVRQRSQEDKLRLEEVQEAMKKHSLESLNLSDGNWATPDLTTKIAQNPRLAAGMANPKFSAALQEMQHNPKAALKKYSLDGDNSNPEIWDFLHEFCGVMGEHFTAMGEAQQKQKQQHRKSKVTPENTRPPKQDLGPLAEAALQRNQKGIKGMGTTASDNHNITNKANNHGNIQQDEELSKDQKRQVDNIVSNPEMAQLLMDPAFQQILQECNDPHKFRQYARHPDHGPKIRKLIEAGVFQVQR
jgi:hypothetical protein